MKAYLFPGQGSQFVGMGKDLYISSNEAKKLFQEAEKILNFSITEIMFSGAVEELRKTYVTQVAIFLHSTIMVLTRDDFKPDMVAGHSLGEFSALVATGSLSFKDGLMLVHRRARAMQIACEENDSIMAAVLGLEDKKVEEICSETKGVVVPANYNCPNQLVISGEKKSVKEACKRMKNEGAKKIVILPVHGAFHSSLMQSAKEKLSKAIFDTMFISPQCPIYQNVDGSAHIDPSCIQKNLIDQLTAPVRWSQSIQAMISSGADEFIECGPGKVLQGLVRKINKDVNLKNYNSH